VNTALSSQAAGFVAFFASGVLLGAAYDILRIWRALFRSEKRSVFVQDFLYMIAAALLSFLVNLGANGGEIRLYLLAGELLGWLAWHFTAGAVTVFLFRRLADFLYARIFGPLGRLKRRLGAKIGKRAARLADSVKKRVQNRKKRLKPRRRIVYNHRKETRRPRYVPHQRRMRNKHESN
jgi:spore cortex biosynthesis protein YabQ